MTYWRYWQLDGAPFTGDSSQPLFRGASVEEAIARIEFLISNRRSVGAVFGAGGVGKSSILRHIASHPPATEETPCLRMFRTSMLGMTGGELLVDLAARLSGNRREWQAVGAWKELCDYFLAASREDIQTVLLVDDVESCTGAAEADLNRIASMGFPLTVIFALEQQALGAVSRSLLERVELQVDLPAWELQQTEQFLAWTAERLGRNQPIFTSSAIERIQQLSYGVARRTIQLADLAMVAGAVAQLDQVDADCIEQVVWELPKSSAA